MSKTNELIEKTEQYLLGKKYASSMILRYRSEWITASGFFVQQIPMQTIEVALLLASLRRLSRQDDQPPLTPVRSLAYFVPVIQEVTLSPLPDDYLQYLRLKLRSFSSR